MHTFSILRTVILGAVFVTVKCGRSDNADSYVAAVYEHELILPKLETLPLSRSKAVAEMMKNLRVFEEQTIKASAQGADIVVFPEDGIYGFAYKGNRDLIYPFLEFVPDPSSSWNPCLDPQRYSNVTDVDVQVMLSCMARNSSIYLVANFGDKQPCDRRSDHKCPADGRYQYNTNLVYDPQGNYVTKYHKKYLYYEFQFDTPEDEFVTFKTPFGTFGLFTCFDILFKVPAVELIQRHNVSNILFLTAWMDAKPFLSSVQFHSSFAILHGVNMLSSNIHLPMMNFHGSGIYTANGAKSYYHNTSIDSGGKLLVARIPRNYQPNLLNVDFPKNPVKQSDQRSFIAKMFKDYHNFVPLTTPLQKATVCHSDLCCNVSYTNALGSRGPISTAENIPSEGAFYALGAFSGAHKNKTYYLQICSIVRCKAVNGSITCGDENISLLQKIDSFIMYGNFSTPYVYPQIVLGDGENLKLTSYPRKWTFGNGFLASSQPFSGQIGVASLFGRIYERDRSSLVLKDDPQPLNSSVENTTSIFLFLCLLLHLFLHPSM